MSLWHRIKLPNGKYEMREIEQTSSPLGDLPPSMQPASVVLPGITKKFKCKLCDKSFNTLGVMSMHFQKTHKEKVEDKDTWRRYTVNTASGIAK